MVGEGGGWWLGKERVGGGRIEVVVGEEGGCRLGKKVGGGWRL